MNLFLSGRNARSMKFAGRRDAEVKQEFDLCASGTNTSSLHKLNLGC